MNVHPGCLVHKHTPSESWYEADSTQTHTVYTACTFPATCRHPQAFWLSQGLAEYQAERLVSELARRGGQYVDPSWLAGRMQQLASALPGPVGALVYEDSDLLVPELADTERWGDSAQVVCEV